MAEFRESLELDLRTSMENSWISSAGCSHYLGLVGDCDTGAVHIHSTFGVRRTENGAECLFPSSWSSQSAPEIAEKWNG